MPGRSRSPKQVETLVHDEAKRTNIPTAEYRAVMDDEDRSPVQIAYARRNRDLDPQLVWRGKDEQDQSDLMVQAPPLFIQEKLHPKVLIDDLRHRSQRIGNTAVEQLDLFADFNGLPDNADRTDFYQHQANWSNRMILGDSLSVMASLAEREGLRGKVQCIYIDPPYGIKFNSNFQWSTTRRDHLLGKQAIVRQLQLVAATATIENPGEHMKRLTGKEFSVIGDEADGAPHYERIVAHIACSDGEQLQVASELQRHVLANGSDGGFITFVDSRKGVETLAMTTQHEAAELLDDASVLPYRAGYRQEDRQKIEKQLQSGELRGIVSTSALELGINLPHLRVGFNVGVPLTRKAYRQRLGRVGRTGPGAFVIIGPPDAFSRYGTTLQEYHERSVEPSYLYLDNRFMQFAHGRCLADEREALAAPAGLPTHARWPSGFEANYIAARPGGNRPPEFDAIAELAGDSPQRGYPLRNVGELNFKIKLHENSDSLGEVSQSQALRECYPGATYLHMAQPFEVAAWYASNLEPFIRNKAGSARPCYAPNDNNMDQLINHSERSD